MDRYTLCADYLARNGAAIEALGLAGNGSIAEHRRELLGSMLREFSSLVMVEHTREQLRELGVEP